ncbi:MAG: hypothetical protein ACOX6T_00720 [Myxococcales bacterium]|jgi:hypothetical protein
MKTFHHTGAPECPPNRPFMGDEDDTELRPSGGMTSRTRRQTPKTGGGTGHKGVPRGGSKLASPEHAPGPRGDNPKRGEALGHVPGGPRHKERGVPAGHAGEGKSTQKAVKKSHT